MNVSKSLQLFALHFQLSVKGQVRRFAQGTLLDPKNSCVGDNI